MPNEARIRVSLGRRTRRGVTFLCPGDDDLLNLKVFFRRSVKGGCGIVA
jgi:hypothetical protein